jgi:hypothetical protein
LNRKFLLETGEAPENTDPLDDVATVITRRTRRRLDEGLKEAVELFRQGTSPQTAEEERPRLLHEASRKLAGMRDVIAAITVRPLGATSRNPLGTASVDSEASSRIQRAEAALPYLLIAHASLELERYAQASRNLVEAAGFNSDVFVDADRISPIASHMGDYDPARQSSDFLEKQLRRHLTLADQNPESIEAQVIGAYSAWRLGEFERARRALDAGAALLARMQIDSLPYYAYAAALRAALPPSSP